MEGLEQGTEDRRTVKRSGKSVMEMSKDSRQAIDSG
jgi:hypothetical protein